MTAIGMQADGHLGVTQLRAMSSEWIKFRSLRSTWWSIGIALLVSVGLGILFSYLRGNDIANHGGIEPDPTVLSLRGFYLAQLAVGVLGVLFITGEYSTGMIRATLSAVPRRMPVWVAKMVIFAGVIFAITLVAAFVAFLGGQAVLGSYHGYIGFTPGPNGGVAITPGGTLHSLGVSISNPGSVRAIFGAALYMMGVGLLGLGCGFITRNTGAAIATLFGLLLVLPLLAQALPNSLQQDITKYLPLLAGTAIMNTTRRDTDQLAPWAGLGVFAIYVVVALGIGLYVLRRRDA